MVIVRPSIVGGALKEPYPGWVDTVSAGGSVYLMAGLGVASLLPGDPQKISDQIPVDFVSNACIVAAADIAKKNMFKVIHCGTSCRNPTTWATTQEGIMRYWYAHRPKSAVATVDFEFIKNPLYVRTWYFMAYTAISWAYLAFSSAIRSKFHLDRAMQLFKLEKKVQFLHEAFEFFTNNEWIFDTRNLEQIYDLMNEEEKQIFFLDVREIDYNSYFQYFMYGMHKWILKENPEPPTITKSDLTKHSTAKLFSDIQFAMEATGEFTIDQISSPDEIKSAVLNSTRVQNVIQKIAEKESLTFAEVEDRALKIMDTMFANPKKPVVKLLGWFFRKIWRKMYHAIVVDDAEIEKVYFLFW